MRYLAVLVVGVALGACSGHPAAAPGTATVPTAVERTTTTDPYAVPATIDVAYVNRVLATFDAINGDAVRLIYQSKGYPGEAAERFRAMYADGPTYDNVNNSVKNDIVTGFKNAKSPPGNQETVVARLITARPDCVFAEIHRDYSKVALVPNLSNSKQWVALKPLDPRLDPKHLNPTGWMYTYEGYEQGKVQPPDQCAHT